MAVFTFKDFVVHQDNSPLKVNTDAILLGTTVCDIATNAKILEVGTGNGLIALLLACRFPASQITAIDSHQGAIIDAQLNFETSKYAQRLKAFCSKLQDFSTEEKFDAIISNPPYYIDGLFSDSQLNNQAKHMSQSAFFDLLDQMKRRMTDAAQLWLILPPIVAQQTISFFANQGLNCTYQLRFHANAIKLDKRWVVCFESEAKECKVQEFCIRNLDGTYHEDYRQLASRFHDREI